MSRLPRLLPLVAVAIGGVMAINLLNNAGDFSKLLTVARAWAEDGPVKAKGPIKLATAAPAQASAAAKTPVPVPQMPSAAPPPAAAPICTQTAAQLASAAGISPAELAVLQSLGARRTELDAREQGDDVQLQLLNATQTKIDGKIASMQDLVTQLKGLLDQTGKQQSDDNKRLITLYEDMDPKQAALQLAIMKDEVRLPIMANMNIRKLAAITNKMTPTQAAEVNEKLAQRTANGAGVDQAKAAVASADAIAAGKADPNATPAKDATAAKPAKAARGSAKGAAAKTTASAPANAAASPTPAATPAKSG